MAQESFISSPIFDCFTIELKAGLDPELEDRAEEVLRGVLGGEAEDWTAQPVHPSRPLMFDLLPPREGALDAKRAWDVTYELRLHPSVSDAEPSFDVLQDNVPDPDEVAPEEVPEALRRAVLEEEEDEEPLDEEGLLAEEAGLLEGPPSLDEDDPEWSPKLVEAPAAWLQQPPGTGAQRGEGVVVAHPDSGFRRHGELFSQGDERVRLDRDRNFVERERPEDAEHEDAGHGLGTASVLMSLDNPEPGAAEAKIVTGTAPAAQLVPMRVAKKRRLIPVPILLSSGMRRLREAVYAAIEQRCHVISISLGWLWNRSLHEAIKQAVADNIIVCAAAGNYVRFVVWPAHYPETIAVAGCTARRTKWKGSSRGKRVDVTAPAKSVWKATIGDDGRHVATQSKGTSYAVATTAGLAALWLAHWGRDFLIERYAGEFTLTNVFRRLLKASCDPPPPNHRGKFGSGIVNAKRLLGEALPTLEQLRASSAPDVETALAGAAPLSMRAVHSFADVFEERAMPVVRRDLAQLLAVAEEEVDSQLPAVGDELMFHLVTNPALRQGFLAGAEEVVAAEGEVQAGLLLSEESPPQADLNNELLGLDGLSDRLRGIAE